MGYLWYYANSREHCSLGYRTLCAHLKEQLPKIDESSRVAIAVMLDKAAVQPGACSGYNVLAQHRELAEF